MAPGFIADGKAGFDPDLEPLGNRIGDSVQRVNEAGACVSISRSTAGQQTTFLQIGNPGLSVIITLALVHLPVSIGSSAV